MKKTIYFLFLSSPLFSFAQFAPRAGEVGSTAIFKDSSVFKVWASSCKLNRGYMNIANPSAGLASVGDENAPLGKAGLAGVASLGDGGNAILTFEKPITNGIGFDFAVFENGFKENGGTFDFLEYAFVEVSSDGKNFTRFPSEYKGNTSIQVASFEPTDTRLYHNFAGKYIGGYGTPFDLEELKDVSGLDINNITHVKIVDVVGSIDPTFATHDSKGNIVNDTYPTEFGSSGFDLDAVGVINVAEPNGISKTDAKSFFSIYPNPSKEFVKIQHSENGSYKLEIKNLQGDILLYVETINGESIPIPNLKSGIYVANLYTTTGHYMQKLIVQ